MQSLTNTDADWKMIGVQMLMLPTTAQTNATIAYNCINRWECFVIGHSIDAAKLNALQMKRTMVKLSVLYFGCYFCGRKFKAAGKYGEKWNEIGLLK